MQMVSDVPFGAFLSGGLDSSHHRGAHDAPQLEGEDLLGGLRRGRATASCGYAGAGGATTSAPSTTSWWSTPSDLMEHLPKLVAFRDAPVAEPSDIPIYMLASEAARSVKMVLTGEGSDEILGGYPKHVYERFAGATSCVPGFLRHGLIEPLAQSLPYGFRRAKTAVTNLNIEDWPRALRALVRRARQRRARRACRRSRVNGARCATRGPPFDATPGNSTLRRILYFDQTSWLPDNLLERGDRMTMAASIESRVPFLDHELAELRLVAARRATACAA